MFEEREWGIMIPRTWACFRERSLNWREIKYNLFNFISLDEIEKHCYQYWSLPKSRIVQDFTEKKPDRYFVSSFSVMWKSKLTITLPLLNWQLQENNEMSGDEKPPGFTDDIDVFDKSVTR